MFGMDAGFMFGICMEPIWPLDMEDDIIELVCQLERPGLIFGIFGMGGLAVPGEGRDIVGGEGPDAHEGLPDVGMGSLLGKLSCNPSRTLPHLNIFQ